MEESLNRGPLFAFLQVAASFDQEVRPLSGPYFPLPDFSLSVLLQRFLNNLDYGKSSNGEE